VFFKPWENNGSIYFKTNMLMGKVNGVQVFEFSKLKKKNYQLSPYFSLPSFLS